ncbi:DNA polymerase III subunit gamma and tau, partial [Streptomyces sp. NPDC058745]
AWPGAATPAPPAAPAPAPAAAQPAAPAAPAGSAGQGAAQVRNMWPSILEAVKNRRRFTWILLSQNAQVAGFDGTTLQLGFLNAGARDNFASSGSEDVLRQALAEQFNVQWKIEAIIDPSGGSAPPPAAANFGGRPPAPPAPAPSFQQAPPPAAPPAHQAPAPPAGPPAHQQSQQSASAPSGPPARQAPTPVAPEDDVPEEDDPDLVDSALSGHELIVRELGATVVEEYTNE